jgi:hypothetical protein
VSVHAAVLEKLGELASVGSLQSADVNRQFLRSFFESVFSRFSRLGVAGGKVVEVDAVEAGEVIVDFRAALTDDDVAFSMIVGTAELDEWWSNLKL